MAKRDKPETGFKMYPLQKKMWDNPIRDWYTGATANYGVIDTILLQALIFAIRRYKNDNP